MPVSTPTATPLLEPVVVTDRGWKVVIYNDDVTPAELVVLGLQKAAGLSLEVADMVMQEAHSQGQATVRRGLTLEDAERMCMSLKKHTRLDGVCPGVDCEPQRDDP